MDYKDVERLLDRYWQCETSLEEEQALRDFFNREEVPARLLPYKSLFVYQAEQQHVGLSDDFDARLLARMAGERQPVKVKARRLTWRAKAMPLFKAAAAVALVLALGNVAQQTLFRNAGMSDYNYDTYKDTYSDPEVAYRQVSSALQILSEGINKSRDRHAEDSIKASPEVEMIKQ